MTQNNASRTCIVVVVVTHESTEMLTCVLMWLGRRAAARGTCLGFQIGQILRSLTTSPTTNTTGRHLGFERDYNPHTAFRSCYVIMHKVFSGSQGGTDLLYFNKLSF